MEFSVRLKELRVEKGLTQRDIAYEVGLTPNSICEWEKGRSEPSSDALKKLAKIFECSIDFLLGISDDFGNVIVYQQTDGVSSLSVDEQKIIDAIRKNAPIYPVDWITIYAGEYFCRIKRDAPWI